MLRRYDPDDPQTFIVNSTGDDLEMFVVTLELREKYLQEISDAKTTPDTYAALCRFIKTINGEPAADVFKGTLYFMDLKEIYDVILANAGLPESVSKNLPPSPDVSQPEKSGDAMTDAEPENDNASITPTQSFAEVKECQN